MPELKATKGPICVVPLEGVTAPKALAAKLLLSDRALAKTATLLQDYPRQQKDILVSAGGEDWPAMIAKAKEYGAGVAYNPEGIDPPIILERVKAGYAAVHAAGLTFRLGVIYANFLKYYRDYAPYCDLQIVQLQRAYKSEVIRLATESVALVRKVNSRAKIEVQTCCYSPNVHDEPLTAAEIASTTKGMLAIPGVGCVYLYFGNQSQYPLCWDVVEILR